TYEIQKTWITHADDRTVIIKKEEPILTLTTCYPFDYIGDAPDRYIIEAKLTGSYSK
ncbi:class D sortase, partial [Bacillus pseudomycoides]